MVHNIFSIYDEKAKAYLPPFFLPEVGMAKRTFSDCVNNKEHQFGRHPGDYTLFRLGAWSDSTAQFTLEDQNSSLGNGLEYITDNTHEDQMALKLVEGTKP